MHNGRWGALTMCVWMLVAVLINFGLGKQRQLFVSSMIYDTFLWAFWPFGKIRFSMHRKMCEKKHRGRIIILHYVDFGHRYRSTVRFWSIYTALKMAWISADAQNLKLCHYNRPVRYYVWWFSSWIEEIWYEISPFHWHRTPKSPHFSLVNPIFEAVSHAIGMTHFK